jgi:23S rRNA (adenine2503-C2)-methyltransferase
MGCAFCLTAKQGFTRNLRSCEIVDQVVQVRRFLKETAGRPEDITNVVFMGMGEPLANFEEVIKAIGNITGSDALNFSHRRVTLSTSGLVPQIRRLGKEATVNLAISLNASDDETRSRIMPLNRKYPLKELLDACRSFPLPNRRMLTFEYILIAGINDSDEDALRLSRLLSGIRAKINLIPLNPHEGLDMQAPPTERILRFQEILVSKHFTAIIRKSKGQDIGAACGQLKGQWLESA